MSTATATPVYSASLPMPSTVRGFFDTLREFGTIKGLDGNYDVTLYLPSEDSGGGAALGARILRLGQALGAKGLAPAFPTGPARYFTGGGTYGWVFGEPTYAGDGQWSIVVPTIDDLRHVLDTVTGLAGFDRSYAGEPTLPVTYHPQHPGIRATETFMWEDLRTIEDEIESYIGERVCFTDPQPVH